MKKIFLKQLIPLCTVILLLNSCKKDFLDAKPSTDIIQPTTLDDFQGLLENALIYLSPGLPTLSADEYNFINYDIYQAAATNTERNAYIWAKDLYGGETIGGDWNAPYLGIFYANNILAGLEKIEGTEKDRTRLNFLKGWALFNRGFAYYELVSNFSAAYDPNTANTDLGVPLKLTPLIEDNQPRSTVKQTYDQILSDLNQSEALLNLEVPGADRFQPSKAALHALFARIYLSMRKYDKAELHADSSLRVYNTLIDYNTVSKTSSQPFIRTNAELLLWKTTVLKYSTTAVFINTTVKIAPDLLALYEANDLRLKVYFTENVPGAFSMKRSYNGATAVGPFTGLATDEVYLIKAECAARRNDLTAALLYLNNLLVKRYVTGSFTPFTTSNASDALAKILLERRKELIWRNLRWSDLKRLNKEGVDITLRRTINNVTYTLSPNDPRWVFPIPDDEIGLSGIPQNVR